MEIREEFFLIEELLCVSYCNPAYLAPEQLFVPLRWIKATPAL
jgi:hypothetical protein